MGKRKRNRSTTRFAVEGGSFAWRSPFEEKGRWWVRKRHIASGRVERVALDAENLTAAKGEVVQKAAEAEGEARELAKAPEQRNPREALLGATLDEWILTLETRPSTMRDYKGMVAQFKEALGATRLVAEITLKDVEHAFFQSWSTNHGRTRMKKRSFLARFFRWAINHGIARVNLAERLEPPRIWRKQARESLYSGKPITAEKARALLAACKAPTIVHVEYTNRASATQEYGASPVLHDAVALSLMAGLRLGNVVGPNALRWSDVNLAKGEESISLDAARMKAARDFATPISDELADLLRARLRAMDRTPKPNERVIADVVELRKVFQNAVKKAKIGTMRFHDCRHSFSSWLGELAPNAIVMKAIGHAPQGVTDRYTRGVSDEAVRGYLNKLPRLVDMPVVAGAAAGTAGA